MLVRTAVIPAAGMGTRLLPATKSQPKELLPLIDTPAIHYVVAEAVQSGIQEIVIITSRHKAALEQYFRESSGLEKHLRDAQKYDLLEIVQSIPKMCNITFEYQQEPQGLGHAILMARHRVGREPFAVMLPDEVFVGEEPCLMQLLQRAEAGYRSVIGLRDVAPTDTSRYGIVTAFSEGAGLHRIRHLVEKPAPHESPSTLAVIGRYVLDPIIFDILSDLPPGQNGEIHLTDALAVWAATQPLYGYEVVGHRHDLGNRLGYLQATVELALNRRDLQGDFGRFLVEVLARYCSGSNLGEGL